MKRLIALFILATQLTVADNKRVYIDVVGDLPHPGHIAMFQRAKAEGDYLIVGVHNDATVASYKRWPIMTMEERMIVIGACRYVDEVVANAPLIITEEYINEHHIDLVIHGDDISEASMNKWYKEPIRLGIFKTIPYTSGISTTMIIERVLDNYCP